MSWEILAVAALVLLALEMLTPITIFLWMAVGVGSAAAASYWGIGWPGQLGFFLAGTAGSLASYLLRRPKQSGPDVSEPAAVLKGLEGVALGELAPQGRVQLDDGSWHARSEDGGAIAQGTRIVVTGHDGATLIVRTAPRAAQDISPP